MLAGLVAAASPLPAAAQGAPPAAAPAAAASAPARTVRAELIKPLQAAQQALEAGQAAEALARLAETDAFKPLQPYEAYVVQRLSAGAQIAAGQDAAALAALEAAAAHPLALPAERLQLQRNAVSLALKRQDLARAAALMQAYLGNGGDDAEVRRLYPVVLAQAGDHAGVVRVAGAQVAADTAAGRVPAEDLLRLLAVSQRELKDDAGYRATLERLAATTGKPAYFDELMVALLRQPGFAEDRLRLDWYRLRRAAGITMRGGEWAELAQRAQLAGFPIEAQAVADEAFAAGLMGQGAEAAEDRKLRDQVTRLAAQDRASLDDSEASARKAADGNALVQLGLALSGAGQHARGLALMQQGFAKGGLRRPDEDRLHLAIVQHRAGQSAQAQQTLAEVRGDNGTAALARLWSLLIAARGTARSGG